MKKGIFSKKIKNADVAESFSLCIQWAEINNMAVQNMLQHKSLDRNTEFHGGLIIPYDKLFSPSVQLVSNGMLQS